MAAGIGMKFGIEVDYGLEKHIGIFATGPRSKPLAKASQLIIIKISFPFLTENIPNLNKL